MMNCTATEDLVHKISGALDRPPGGACSCSSGLLFFLLICTATACLLAVALSFVQRQRHRRGLLAAGELAAADDSRLRALLGEALPSW